LLLGVEYALLWSAWRTQGDFALLSIAVLSAALAALWTRAWGAGLRGRASGAAAVVGGILAAAVVWELVSADPLMFARFVNSLPRRILALLALAALAAGWLAKRRRTARAWLAAGTLTFGLFLAFQLVRSPRPIMDVWHVTTQAADAFLSGSNPYGRFYSDIYREAGWVGYGYPMEFVYLPGTLLHAAVPRLLGLDIRWASLIGLTAGLLLFASCVRRRSEQQRRTIPTIATAAVVVIFWFHSGQVFLLEQAWAEGLLVLYICLAFWAWRRHAWLAAAALVCALSIKQTVWFCVPFFLALAAKERRWKGAAAVAVGVALVVGPFFLWDPAAFLRSVVEVLLVRTPPRPDSLTWSAAAMLHAPSLQPAVGLLSFVAYGGAFVALCVRLRRSSAEDAVWETLKWTTLGLFGVFLFLKMSFFNYYYLVCGLLAFYLVSADTRSPTPPATVEACGI
jgi:hypothetical protein